MQNKLVNKLLEDLKSECNYIYATEEEIKHSRLIGMYEFDEDREHDLKVSENIKEYLEGILGVTFVLSDDKSNWIKKPIGIRHNFGR